MEKRPSSVLRIFGKQEVEAFFAINLVKIDSLVYNFGRKAATFYISYHLGFVYSENDVYSSLNFFNDNANCGSKLCNAALLSGKNNMKKSSKSEKENRDKLCRQITKSFGDVIVKEYLTRTRYSELELGDPSRNIIEMIFQKASTNPSNALSRIERVLRVKNSFETLAKFEKYRDNVKQIAYQQHQMAHPRSIVDGNELLRFYGTTMSCCGEQTMRVSEICRDLSCRVCKTIQCNFDTEYSKKNGIRFSTNSEKLTDSLIGFSRSKTERAVVVCRIIAGAVANKVDRSEIEYRYLISESLIVRDPSAVLPCFVIVFT
ncbi:uncharacterized protein LOC126668107 [Mercurialis annua]|uniref:uncharacterized protein LOC126668107 n=1 Tax=Mercurialis annua TaxID=3986 RepID=UPI00215FDF50|nr:uncharacterized protein LOC126668107 [Mercurialis annua]